MDVEEERATLTAEALLRDKGTRNNDVILQRQRRRERSSPGYLCTRIYRSLQDNQDINIRLYGRLS